MNTVVRTLNMKKPLMAAAVAAVLLAACATAPVKPEGAAHARNMLTQLQADPNLANRAPISMQQAEAAVRIAEQPETDQQLVAYRVYMADRKVETARAEAETKFAEDQRGELIAQREKVRLDARTREADLAAGKVAMARAEGAEQKAEADAARNQAGAAQAQADVAQAAALSAQQQAEELQRQIDTLQAKVTDRGLVLTLGDVLFATAKADLSSGANGTLNKLVAFLNKYPDRTVDIQGYTDSVGSEDYNLGLSQRRADSVRSYLVGQGIGSGRLVASGKGMSSPVAGNDTSSGRQQNRRVEVIINNPAAAMR
jgi:outer membrane protein OmpA-like peptidoglycan-associated protein